MTLLTCRCLVDSKISRSKFEQRQKASELRLSLQAFRFGLGQEVTCFFMWLACCFWMESDRCLLGIHPLHHGCLGSQWSWQHQEGLSLCEGSRVKIKASPCYWVILTLELNGVPFVFSWELLDNPVYSSICDCCDSSCKTRRARSPGAGMNLSLKLFFFLSVCTNPILFFRQWFVPEGSDWPTYHSWLGLTCSGWNFWRVLEECGIYKYFTNEEKSLYIIKFGLKPDIKTREDTIAKLTKFLVFFRVGEGSNGFYAEGLYLCSP